MNQAQPYMDMQSQMSSGQPYSSQAATAPSLSHYSPYPPQQVIQSAPPHYASTPHSYGSYAYPNGVPSPQSATQPPSNHQVHPHPQAVTLPAMMPGPPPQHGYMGAGNTSGQTYANSTTPQFDQTGQVAPPGMKPRVTATLWEDEGSLCYQVEAKGVCVARREDNHMINGTKLLNVAGMTRGRRDGILKSEKVRHVVKIGPMHLKGVWIPFARALDFANKEKITDSLYPLFVHNIGGLLYHPTNESRTSAVVAATERRRIDGAPARNVPTSQGPPLHHQQSVQSSGGPPLPPAPHSIAPHPGAPRPGIERAHTFPTPPTSASSVIGMSNQGSSYEWGPTGMANPVSSGQPLSIDTGLSNNRSMPTTPASTPPGSSLSSMPTYPGAQNFEGSKVYYSGAPSSQSAYASQPTPAQANLARFGAPLGSNTLSKTEMGPPTAPGTVGHADGEHHDLKSEPYANGHVSASSTEGGPGQQHDAGYMNANSSGYGGGSRASYGYNPPSSIVHSDPPHLSPEMATSPHGNGSGRATPHSTSGSAQWQSGYHTPPRPAPSSNLYQVMGDSKAAQAAPTTSSFPSSYGGTSLNGTSTSTKRSRDDESDAQDGSSGARGHVDGPDAKSPKHQDWRRCAPTTIGPQSGHEPVPPTLDRRLLVAH